MILVSLMLLIAGSLEFDINLSFYYQRPDAALTLSFSLDMLEQLHILGFVDLMFGGAVLLSISQRRSQQGQGVKLLYLDLSFSQSLVKHL